jgi:hypothetical protein
MPKFRVASTQGTVNLKSKRRTTKTGIILFETREYSARSGLCETVEENARGETF